MDSPRFEQPRRAETRSRVVDGRIFDAPGGGDHDPRLYQCQREADSVAGLKDVDDEAIARYHQQGYLVVRQAFTVGRIGAVKEALADAIDSATPGSTAIQFESWAVDELDKLDRRQKALAVRKFLNVTDHDPRLKAVARDQQLLQLVGRLLGDKTPEVLQEMALLKPPGGREKPWHQDRAYFNMAPGVPVVGCWLALDRATAENGCMRISPARHRGGAMTHFQLRDWQICDREVLDQQRVAVPLLPGGLLLFDSLLPHGTPTNQTRQERWALQIHFCPIGAPRIDDRTRMTLFGFGGDDRA